ncbi:MAG TPA: RDD family protein, partial [Candidatus Limnocylindrales bacterium]|nr:RDD family protein [Candidatus Limnocylindrales bacterium]
TGPMTWQDPGGNPAPGGPGGPEDDATRSDWNLAELDARVSDGGARTEPPAGDPAPPAPPAPPPAPGYGAPAPAPGYGAPAPAPAYAPGMAWEPPTTYGTAAGPGGGLEYAGVGGRFVAWLIDQLILGAVAVGISITVSLVVLGTMDWSAILAAGANDVEVILDGDDLARAILASLAASAASLAVGLAYYVFQWTSRARATIGMRVLGLQVGNAADGATLTRGQAVRRWLAFGSWAGVLGAVPALSGILVLAQVGWSLALLITTASHPRRQGLHDQFAGTAIVQEAGRNNNGVVVGCLVLAVLLLVVLPLISIVALLALGSQVETILSTVGESV